MRESKQVYIKASFQLQFMFELIIRTSSNQIADE